jgi:hypothetical protein
MSVSSPASSNNIKYYSAHRGPVCGADGKFHHFARQCDPVHLKNGYWQFSTYDDDRRAHMHGFHNPEEVLKAQDAGDGEYDDILLLWVPGQLDTSNKTSMGTAAVHLQTVYNERKLLRKTLSFRGAVPLYPVSTDPRLLQYRLTRYGVQRGKLPTDLLSPTSSSQDMRLMQTLSPAPPPTTTITPIDSTSRAKGPVSHRRPHRVRLSIFYPPHRLRRPLPLTRSRFDRAHPSQLHMLWNQRLHQTQESASRFHCLYTMIASTHRSTHQTSMLSL